MAFSLDAGEPQFLVSHTITKGKQQIHLQPFCAHTTTLLFTVNTEVHKMHETQHYTINRLCPIVG